MNEAYSVQIAFFIYSLSGGGAERVTVHMADFWSKKGHEVTIFTMASTENNRYQLPKPIELISLKIDGKSKGLLTAVWNNIRRIRVLREEVRKRNPDIIISMMPHANVMTGLACIGLDTACIGSERNFPGIDYTGTLWGLLRRFCYRFIDTVVTQTEVGKEWILENTNALRVVAIPNPIVLPLPINEPVIAPPSQTNRKYIIGVGRLTKQKQFHHLIQVFANISGDFENWDLIIIGEGEDKTKLHHLSTQLSVQDRVKLPGRVGNIADWYLAAQLFVMTSETEGFPNALIEAMAHGVAVVSYDCPTGPREIIKPEVNGLLVEANDKIELEKQIRRLIKHDQKRKDLTKASKQISDTLNIDNIMSRWDKVITDILTEAD